jgi:hypothetical protein
MQLVRENCANYQSDGSCLGAMIEEGLSLRRGTPQPRCLVADARRCPYYEACVAPLADMAGDPRRAAALQEAVAGYRQITHQKAPKARPCPDCGRPIQKGRHYCPRCADARRKASNRTAQSRRRDSAVAMSAEVQKNSASFPEKTGLFFAVSQNAIEDSDPPQNDPTSADIHPAAGRAS